MKKKNVILFCACLFMLLLITPNITMAKTIRAVNKIEEKPPMIKKCGTYIIKGIPYSFIECLKKIDNRIPYPVVFVAPEKGTYIFTFSNMLSTCENINSEFESLRLFDYGKDDQKPLKFKTEGGKYTNINLTAKVIDKKRMNNINFNTTCNGQFNNRKYMKKRTVTITLKKNQKIAVIGPQVYDLPMKNDKYSYKMVIKKK